MARRRYDHRWKEVQCINGYAMLKVYLWFVISGIGFLVVTWTTVVLLGGFVTNIDTKDFWRLTVITVIQILWINTSFFERAINAFHLESSSKTVKDLFMRKWQVTDNARGGHPNLVVVKRVVAKIRAVVGWVLALVHNTLLYLCILFWVCLFFFGLPVTTSLSIYGLVKRDYYGEDGDRRNMYPAHNVLYFLCVAQGALFIYLVVLVRWEKRLVNKVSQAYGFRDDRLIIDYGSEIYEGCAKKPSSATERNLITYAIELMESKSPSSFLSGTLILDRLLMRQYSDQIKAPTLIEQQEEKQQQRQQQKQLDLEDKAVAQLIKKEKEMKDDRRNHMEERKKKREERRKKRQRREEAIIVQQRTVIKRLIGSESSTHILQKLLQTLDSRRSHDKKMREAAARIVEHVACGIRLEQFPRGINCISSLLNNFEEYRRLQLDKLSSSPSPSNTNEATTATMPLPSNTNENNDNDQEQGSYSSSESESEAEPEPASDYSESEPESESYNGIYRSSSSKPFNGYKDLVLTGLSILWRLAGSEDNCIIISNTKHLVSKIVAPISYDLVHRTHHSAWSTSVVEASMRVMLRLIATAKDTNGDIGPDLCQQISNNEAITTMEKIVTCEECKGGELQLTAMQILMQLSRCSFTMMLIEIFIKGDCSDASVRKTAGKELVLLFLSSKSALLPKEENNEFVRGLAEIVSQVGNDDECRKVAAEILEHMCIHYTENGKYLLCQKEENDEYLRKNEENEEYLGTLKHAMAGATPKILREILRGHVLTGEKERPGYARVVMTVLYNLRQLQDYDIESQDAANGKTSNKKIDNKKNNNNTSFWPWQNQHQKLYVALLSLYVTACEKLDLDIDAISPGEGDQGEGVAFRLAMQMVQSNRHRVSAYSLTVIKLSTRMFIATMMKLRVTNSSVVKSADLESLMDSLTSISENMLDLEGSMVFTAGTMTVPAIDDTLDSLVKQARELHREIKNQDSEINVS